jgi:hypothetical protein
LSWNQPVTNDRDTDTTRLVVKEIKVDGCYAAVSLSGSCISLFTFLLHVDLLSTDHLFLSNCLFLCTSTYVTLTYFLSTCNLLSSLPIYFPTTQLSIHPSVRPTIHPSIYPSTHLSVCPSICLYVYIPVSTYLPIQYLCTILSTLSLLLHDGGPKLLLLLHLPLQASVGHQTILRLLCLCCQQHS